MKKIALLIVYCSIFSISFSQNKKTSVLTSNSKSLSANQTIFFINWKDFQIEQLSDNFKKEYVTFEGAVYSSENQEIPYYSKTEEIQKNYNNAKVELIDEQFIPFENQTKAEFFFKNKVKDFIEVKAEVGTASKKKYLNFSFIPVVYRNGKYLKLISFNLKKSFSSNTQYQAGKSRSAYAGVSELAKGTWYKIATLNRGVHKIDYNFFIQNGIPINDIDPRKINVFGNGGKMLNEKNSLPYIDDLKQNAIYVSGEGDGVFNQNDYILFFGEDALTWKYNETERIFEHSNHLYSDTVFYFLCVDHASSKRIQNAPEISLPANVNVSSFNDYKVYEAELYNFIKSGRQWFGDNFDITTNKNYQFSFPNISNVDSVKVKGNFAARNSSATTFTLQSNGRSVNVPISSVNVTSYTDTYAAQNIGRLNFLTSNPNISIAVNFNKSGNASGWLDYLIVNAKRNLVMNGNQLIFRDVASVGAGNVANFSLSNANEQTQIWDLSDISTIKNVSVINSGGSLSFKASSSSLVEYIAFNQSGFLTPIFSGKVENQNLHGLDQADYIIVSHPKFLTHAEELAQFHREENMTVHIVTTNQVYNEFSSGSVDASAIKRFVKMFYDRASSEIDAPKYLLLFGDGSYKNKSLVSNNTNFIPSYQSPNSVNPISSFTSDDFFGMLDDNEGDFTNGLELVDVGVGRIVAKNEQEARAVVNKIKRYNDPESFGNWRSKIAFVADDEDGNLHINHAEQLIESVSQTKNSFNIKKIFFDQYVQEYTSGGQRYPAVNSEINTSVNNGLLIMNYTGHGGETGWAHERVLTNSDVLGWNNKFKMPLFLTATCEFSRWEDPDRTSGGEYVLLNENGGGIALFSTTRLVFAYSNLNLNLNFYKALLEKDNNGNYGRVGDIFKKTKIYSDQSSSNYINNRNFSLLGDPALKLAIPKYNVTTVEMNTRPSAPITDTISALELVTVKGFISDDNGQIVSGFNGVIYPTVFDKKQNIQTRNNDVNSPTTNFKTWNKTIFRGKASVKNGNFEFTFLVPKDIAFNYDFGRIEYYALSNNNDDAMGDFEQFIIGGINTNASADVNPPTVNLYMNNDKFVFGGLTNQNPNIYAKVFDESGVNTSGGSIGHDLVSFLNEDTKSTIVLNDHFEFDLDSYQSGTVTYPLENIPNGRHSARIRVWDNFNNSAEDYTEFVVENSASIALERILNYPNPFTTYTEFHLEHNQPGENLSVDIQIYTVSGKLVKTISRILTGDGFRAEPIAWNGLDEYGDKIGRGVYVYRVKIKNPQGKSAEKFEKLVILN